MRQTARKIGPSAMAEDPNAGAFQGRMAASGMKATFPLGPLSPDSEVAVDYTGAGFAGMSEEDGKTRFRFDAKSLR